MANTGYEQISEASLPPLSENASNTNDLPPRNEVVPEDDEEEEVLEKAKCLLKKEQNLMIQDIVSSFNYNDTRIVCQSTSTFGKLTKVPASSLMLSMASLFLKRVFGDVLEKTLRVEDESHVIILPDFDESTVCGMLECMATGDYRCNSQKEYNDLDSLLSAVCLNRGQIDFNKVNEKVPAENKNHSKNGSRSVEDVKEPKEEIIEDYDYDYSDDDDREDEEYLPKVKVEMDVDENEINVETVKKEFGGSRKFRIPEGYGPCDDDGQPLKKKPDRPPKEKITTDPKRSKKNPCCPVCGFDGGTYESSVQHIEELLQDHSYKVPALVKRKGTKKFCPICRKDLFNDLRLRLHFKGHMEEAHNREKECTSCNITFEKT